MLWLGFLGSSTTSLYLVSNPLHSSNSESEEESSYCMELGSGFGGGLLEAGDPCDVVCVGGVGGRSGDVCFGGGGGTLVFGGEGVGVAGRILVGFGVAFGELVVGLEVGVFDFVFADVDLEFVFVDVDLEVVDFLLEAAGVAFFQ